MDLGIHTFCFSPIQRRNLWTHRRHVPILSALWRTPDPLPFVDLTGGHVKESTCRVVVRQAAHGKEEGEMWNHDNSQQLIFVLCFVLFLLCRGT